MSNSFTNNRTSSSAYIDDFPYHNCDIPQAPSTGMGAENVLGMSGTNGMDDINQTTWSSETRPRWDQRPLAPSTSSDGLTLSHTETTEYTESVYDDDGVAASTHKEKKKMASSVYSYNSTRDLSHFLTELYGRTFNKLNEAYALPSDEGEWSRLDKQHVAQLIAMGNLTPCQDLVDAVLVPEHGVEKKVLDLGCGSGVWPIEMARKYPHTSVTCVDVAPIPFDRSILPINMTFEIYDINEGLEHYCGQFDVIHMRCVMIGLRDFERTLREIQLCAKPGGVIIIIDGDANICDEDRLHVAKMPDVAKEGPDSPGSWFRRMMWEVDTANHLTGANPTNSGRLVEPGLWSHPLCDPETAASGEYFLPIRPWPKVPDLAQTQQLGYAGSLIRQGMLNIHRAWHANLLRFGMDQQLIDGWSRKVDEEIGEMKVKLWVRFRFAYARRRAAPDEPAHPLPSLVPKSDSPRENRGPTKYPYINYFRTAEEAARNIERRREAYPPDPESECKKAWSLKQTMDQSQGTAGHNNK